jgi:hypothetical protein
MLNPSPSICPSLEQFVESIQESTHLDCNIALRYWLYYFRFTTNDCWCCWWWVSGSISRLLLLFTKGKSFPFLVLVYYIGTYMYKQTTGWSWERRRGGDRAVNCYCKLLLPSIRLLLLGFLSLFPRHQMVLWLLLLDIDRNGQRDTKGVSRTNGKFL